MSDQVARLREQVHQLEAERASLLHRDADIDAWLTAHRTDRWVHLVLAVLQQPDEFV